VNLDRFRLVNDVMGQAIGNRLIKQVGLRFQSCLQTGGCSAAGHVEKTAEGAG
jgi:GGDEF domain-containing protein